MRQTMRELGKQTGSRRSSGAALRAYRLGLVGLMLVCLGAPAVAAPVALKDLAQSTAAEKAPGSSEAMDAAIEELNKQAPDFEKALESFKAAVEKDPRWPPARVLMAKFFLLRGSIPGAQDQLEQLAKEAADEPETYLLLGEMAFGFRRIAEAKLLFEEGGRNMAKFSGNADRKKNLDERVVAGLASVAEAREQWDVAIPHLEAWIKINPDSHAAHQRLGAVLFRKNPKDDAARKAAYAEFQKAVKIDDKLATPDVMLMQLFEQAGDRKNADVMAKRAVKNSPDNARVQLEVAQWMVGTGQFAEAKPHAERALQITPDSLDAKVLRAVVARYLRELDEAEQLLNDAKVQEPNAVSVNDQLALVLIESPDTSKHNRALSLAQDNLERNRQSTEAAWTWSWILFKLGRTQEAERAMAQSLNASRQIPPDAAYYFASLSLERGRKNDAAEAIKKALESPLPFYYRKEAEALQQTLQK